MKGEKPVRTDQVGARRRAEAYWFEDGLPELAFGSVLLATAAVLGVAALTAPGIAGPVMALGLPLVLVVGIPLAGSRLRDVKRTSTYARTGVVRYGSTGSVRRVVHWLLAVGLAGVLAWLA